MGCGNSSPASTTSKNNSSSSSSNSSSSQAGHVESSSKASEEEDDKFKNYGGVYVGFPADMSNIPQLQIGPLRERDSESERDPMSLRKPLWGNGLQF